MRGREILELAVATWRLLSSIQRRSGSRGRLYWWQETAGQDAGLPMGGPEPDRTNGRDGLSGLAAAGVDCGNQPGAAPRCARSRFSSACHASRMHQALVQRVRRGRDGLRRSDAGWAPRAALAQGRSWEDRSGNEGLERSGAPWSLLRGGYRVIILLDQAPVTCSCALPSY